MLLLGYLVLLGIITELVLIGAVIGCSLIHYPPVEADCVIVLGSRVWPDGRVSNALQYRLEAAAEAYAQGRAGAIIVTGAQGGTEPVTEALAGRDYLVETLGVPESVIYMEDRSYDTIQNMENAKAIMRAQGFETALIATSDYHMMRAMWIAGDVGLKAYALPSKSPVKPSTWCLNRIRETISWMLYGARKIL